MVKFEVIDKLCVKLCVKLQRTLCGLYAGLWCELLSGLFKTDRLYGVGYFHYVIEIL